MGEVDIDENDYTEGTLVIDIVDMGTKQLAWRGLGTKVLSGNYQDNTQGQEMVQENIDKILTNFPPPPPGSSSGK